MTAANGEFGKLVVETTAAVNMMALVSPAALANPKMAPVKIPGSAAEEDFLAAIEEIEAGRPLTDARFGWKKPL